MFKTLIALAFITHTLTSNVCLMTMNMAMGVPTDHPTVSADAMMIASHDDCDHCLHHEETPESPLDGCDGSCFAQTNAVTSMPSGALSLPDPLALPLTVASANSLATSATVDREPKTPPGKPPQTRMVVFLQ